MSHQTVKQSAIAQTALTIIRLRLRNVCIYVAGTCVRLCAILHVYQILFVRISCFLLHRNLSGHLTHRHVEISETICF